MQRKSNKCPCARVHIDSDDEMKRTLTNTNKNIRTQ